MAVIAIPVSHTKTKQMPDHGMKEDQKRTTPLHAGTPRRGRLDIPFTEAKAVGRAIVAWGWSAIRLVGYIRPRRALWEGRDTGSVMQQWQQ